MAVLAFEKLMGGVTSLSRSKSVGMYGRHFPVLCFLFMLSSPAFLER